MELNVLVTELFPLISNVPLPILPTVRKLEFVQFPPLTFATPLDPKSFPMSPNVLVTVPFPLISNVPSPESPTVREPEFVQFPPLTLATPVDPVFLPI